MIIEAVHQLKISQKRGQKRALNRKKWEIFINDGNCWKASIQKNKFYKFGNEISMFCLQIHYPFEHKFLTRSAPVQICRACI